MRSNPGTPTLNTMERPLSTDTKSAIGGTRMSEAATPAVAAGNRVSTTRIVGAAAIAFAVSWALENAVLAGSGAPTYGAPIEEALAYYAANRVEVAIASSQVALYRQRLLL